MSTINKSLSGFIFTGGALPLASADFKGNLNAVYGFNSAGTGYTSFKPGNTFNSLTQLTQDGVYIVDAKTTGFELPGASLAPTSSGILSPIELHSLYATAPNRNTQLTFHITATGVDSVVIFANQPEGFKVSHALVPGQETSISTGSQDLTPADLDSDVIALEFYRGSTKVLSYSYRLHAIIYPTTD